MRDKWARRFLDLAELVAEWSKDPSTRVGACIVDGDRRIVSVGFNGFAKGVSDEKIDHWDREERLRRTIHAEDNAILFAQRPLEGCTIYITHPPCARCAAKIIQSGIDTVVARASSSEFSERWAEDFASASAMFLDAGVECIVHAPQERLP